MNISGKLRLIQEGHSIEDINSGRISPFSLITESENGLSLFTESVISDIEYMTEMSLDILNEGSGFSDFVKKFFAWIGQKIMQFISFIKQIFTSNKADTEKLNKTIKESIARIQTPEFKLRFEANGIRQIEVNRNVYDIANEDFMKNGINVIFDILDRRALDVINDTSGDPASFNPDIENEEKFLNTIFHEAFDVNYKKDAILETLYGPIKRVDATTPNLIILYTKLSHLEDQERKIVDFIKSTITKNFTLYETALHTHIARSVERIERINNPEIHDHETEILARHMDSNTIIKQNYLMDVNKVKIQQISKLFKYTLRLANECMLTHKAVTDKLRSAIAVTVTV